MTDIRELLRRQIELEDEGRGLGESRYHSRKLPWRTEAGSLKEEADLAPGQQLMRVAIPPVAEAIEAFLAEMCARKAGRLHSAVHPLLLAEPAEAAYITMRVMVNCAISQSMMTTLAIKIADALIENVEFKAFREMNKKGYKGYMKKQDARGYSRQRAAAVKKMFQSEGVSLEVSERERAIIGTKLIEMVMDSTGLFVRDSVRRAKGMAYAIRPSETLLGWFDNQHARCALLHPITMPMIVRPRRWRTPTYGGYLTPRPGNKFIKQRNRAYHDEVRNADLTDVYDAVNHIQDTPWRINARVLSVMEQVWEDGTDLGGLPQRNDDPIPAKPVDIDTNEDAKATWKRAAAETHTRNAERLSARLSVHQGLWVSRRFAPEERIYFPHELDFRGRVYPISQFGPSPQGCDWQKALIHFADGKPLGDEGRRWLMIHIANLFGVDKVPFDDRIDWVLEHSAQLLDSADNPLDGARFWTTADSPFMALAACFEFAGMLEQGADYVSFLPVALDGSCSGLQHFSAMLRDEEGGRAVNLLPAECPQDVYMAVARKAQEMADCSHAELLARFPAIAAMVIKGKDENGTEVEFPTEPLRAAWAGTKIKRPIAKRPTMTYCYSATRFGMQAMILQTLKEMDREAEAKGERPYLEGVDNCRASVWLSHVLYSSIGLTVRAASTAMDWLRAAAKVAATESLPLWWTTPMGLPILQEYKEMHGVVVRTHWAGKTVEFLVNKEGDKLDSRAQANGVAPNFVHSLDASHLQSVALRAKREGIRHIAVIHDSFGTHACDTGNLSRILRETFVEQYSGDVLGDFYNELKDQLGDELAAQLPPPPTAGSLDLSLILEAQYTFA